MANKLSFNPAYYSIFRNLSVIAYIIDFQKSKFANILFREFYQPEPGPSFKIGCIFSSCRVSNDLQRIYLDQKLFQ